MRVELFTSQMRLYRRDMIYAIVDFGGKQAEFCVDGNIKVSILEYEVQLNEYANMPSKEDLDLFYVKEDSIYLPLMFNARLK